jgi:methylated-DNA-[protein]-cysteine S-methyltransferase
VTLEMDGVPPFHRRVYEAAREITPGATVSYGEVAARLGAPGSARAVGQALARNPFAIVVPCHRVLAAGGKVGGFSADGGIATKLRLLSIESRHARAGGALSAADNGVAFDTEIAIQHLRQCDAALAQVIDAVGRFRLELQSTNSTFATLAQAIVYQQLTAKAAATIFARLCALFPHGHEGFSPAQLLRVSDARLRSAGLSGSKVLSLRDLARRAQSGEVPPLHALQQMQDDTIVERLTAVRGIGRWTAQMLLIFRLGRPDVLPVDDYGVRKGFAAAFNKRALPTPEQLARHGERWRPYRTVASWYLWRALDLAKKET